MASFEELNELTPLHKLRQFVKQNKLEVCTEVGGRRRRKTHDVYQEIRETYLGKELDFYNLYLWNLVFSK